MTHDSKTYFHPEILARIPRLRLRSRCVVEGFLAGEHRGTAFGHSSEFKQHREYVPGDDPRFIDWKVWARQDRLYVREHELETNRRLVVLVDHSGSMAYRGRYWTKYDCAATLAVSLVWLAVLRRDAAGCILFRSGMTDRTAATTDRACPLEVAAMLEKYAPDTTETPTKGAPTKAATTKATPPTAATEAEADVDISEPFRYVTANVPRGALVAVLSDLFVRPEPFFDGLRMLKGAGHEPVVFHLLDDDELDLPFEEPTRFTDLETRRVLRCDARAVRDSYRDLAAAFTTTTRSECLKLGARYHLLRTGTPLDAALSAFFAHGDERS